MNPYFEPVPPLFIADVETLLTLNTRKVYGTPGKEYTNEDINRPLISRHETAGLFRGQVRDWPLIPGAWRSLNGVSVTGSRIEPIRRSVRALSHYNRFCERARAQNPLFPSLELERMCIAQHFGVPTALLDWSQNIFAAVFFSIREALDQPEEKDDPRTFIYHVIDERLLAANPPRGEELIRFKESAFVGPFYADRLIERQRGVFTYHPDPLCSPKKIPVQVYALEFELIVKLQKLMEGFGFTHDYFFPDYAGIAHTVTRRDDPWL